MKTKHNFMKKLMLFSVAFAFCFAVFAKPIDADAAIAAPTGLYQSDYTSDGTAVQIKWDAVIGATGGYEYAISTNQNAEGGKSAATSVNGANIYGLTQGTTYYVKVRAYEGTTPSAWSAITKLDTAPAALPSVKQNGAEAKKISISWGASAGATGYEVSYGLNSDGSNPIFTTNVTSTSYTFNVGKDSAYYVFVYPYRNAANANSYVYSTGKVFIGVTKPSTPKSLNIAARSYIGRTSVSPKTTYFTWKPVSNINNTDGYELQIFKSNGKSKIKTLNVSGYVNNIAKYTSAKLFKEAFQYRVRSYVTVNGKKYYSSWSSKKIYVPAAVIKHITTYGRYPSSGTLKWNKVSGAKSYTVYHKTSQNGKWKAVAKNVKGTSANVKFSSYSDNYYYVRANQVKIGKKKYNSTSKNFDGYVFER